MPLPGCLPPSSRLWLYFMELAAQCHQRGIRLRLDWAPREQNVEADELSEGIARRCISGLRVGAELWSLPFLVLPSMMAHGEDLYEGLAHMRVDKRAVTAAADSLRHKKPRTHLESW